MKIWKYSGILLILTGGLHTLVALLLGKDVFLQIIRDGVVNAIAPDDFAAQFAFWFLICGLFILPFGFVLHHYIKKTQQPPPRSLGYALLIIAVFGCVIAPVSGFWLILLQALIIIFAKQEKHSLP